MGSSSSKFKKYLHHGDEFAAMQVYQSAPELQRNLNPNLSYGEHHNYNTALHYAAKHGMKHLLRTFLNDLGGNPNKKNGSNQTSLHAVCQLSGNKSLSRMERRAACVSFILQWRGTELAGGGREKIDLAAQDQAGNTALHLAAASGLEHCVQALVASGCPLYTENNDKMTPCDLAVKHGYHAIAQLLESKMDDAIDNTHNEDENIGEEVYCGLRTQDLQEAKDQLLVETSDMLQVPLFTAEALLRDNEWSRELLLDKWVKGAVACCESAGVEPPSSALLQHADVPLSDDILEVNRLKPTDSVEKNPQEIQCGICLMSVKVWEQPNIKISCNHNFCVQCWESYLSSKILEGMHHDILCPAYDCSILVPLDVIERLVSPDLTRRYLYFDIKAFVESNKCIKWCPVAGCGRAVKFPEAEYQNNALSSNEGQNSVLPPVTSHAVDCGNGHFFCWECLGEAHAPSGCAQWRLWLDKVNQVRPEELDNNLKDLEVASNCLWLVSNSKPCPNCKSPIQKNEGCNHIKCSKCKFDFCWVCLETWKKHSSATGGYFRCNRFPAVVKADEKRGDLFNETVARNQQIQDLNRFIHYYTRYKNHENSRKLEEPLLTAVQHKMEIMASSLASGKDLNLDKEKNCTKFIEDGVRELLKARRVLCGSYVYGFYLEDNGYNRSIFEFMQNELESVTCKLSEMIARPYLKTPRHTIMTTTALARRKRHEFVRAVAKGLVPPETPPSARRHAQRRKRLLLLEHATSQHLLQQHDSDMSHAIAASLKSLDTSSSWVKDAEGRHNNLSAIYEWPDADDGEEGICNTSKKQEEACLREGCGRVPAHSPRTHAPHKYCSVWCAATSASPSAATASSSTYGHHDDAMDLAIALEMSRLQMIEDTIKRAQRDETIPKTSVSVAQTDSDFEQHKSIELSLKTENQQTAEIGITTEDSPSQSIDFFRKTKEDITIDYFLKSLASGNDVNLFKSNPSNDKVTSNKDSTIFKARKTEDGRFEIGEIHESCFNVHDSDDGILRRARSTGDLNNRKKEPKYQIDSDHSSQHDEKPEEIASQKDNPSTTNNVFSVDLEVCHILSPEPNGITDKENFLKPSDHSDQSRTNSVKNLFDEVQKTLKNTDNNQIFKFDYHTAEFYRHCPERASTGKIKNQTELQKNLQLATAATRSATTLENLYDYERKFPLGVRKHQRNLNESHKRAFRAAGGKIPRKDTTNGLRIRIAKSPITTDSSNEYETETGIPRSPTLFISGVSISRTPEPCSPASKRSPELKIRNRNISNLTTSSPILNIISASIDDKDMDIFPPEPFEDKNLLKCARQGRSSSLTVPQNGADSGIVCKALNTSCCAIVSMARDQSPPAPNDRQVFDFTPRRKHERCVRAKSETLGSKQIARSDVFRFPKSSTEGSLSSVLHVQENNLSSDDFHEVLFLLERSPRSSKRRKKSKDREKLKDDPADVSCVL